MPYPSLGSLFNGREQFLADLHAKLTKSRHTAAAITTRPQAVHGAGGIGKTRDAIEYAWRHTEDYTALQFLAADSPAALESSLAGLVGVLPETIFADLP